MSQEEAKKSFEQRRTKERECMYAELNLSSEQKAKAEAIDAKTKAEAGKLIRKFHMEAKKLRDLKAQKALEFDICKQKIAVKSARKDVDKYFKESRKAFEAILTKEQKVKFDSIMEAKRKEMKKFKKHRRHGVQKKCSHGHCGHGPCPLNPPIEGTEPKLLPECKK